MNMKYMLKNPKKPDRKKGVGKFTNCQSPQEEDMYEIINVELHI